MTEIRYAKIINEDTKEVLLGAGCDDEYYEHIGMTKMEVEMAYNYHWYVAGFAPEPTVDEKKMMVRGTRDNYIYNIEWRVSRYRDQKEMQVLTTDTEETYHSILQYMQYLRDYPESSETWYEQRPMTWDEWNNNLDL